ncbi:response regulator [Lysobacter solisilvae (ex Woo and Kim 2020)]|uniref:Response regulator n=1 Tax=Agrilutibacter terrestris TaxID=2865112 RepID=A0A7H0FY83_9GAMM|nr:response regulator [Lysobacter terrestris]QNP40999.1 response regulator [Lysobacter terrestris]
MTSAPRVLLVEDDPVSRAFLTVAVQALPATVDAADSMAAAIALAAAGPYDLWLIDANLPDGSGAQLLARLRGRDATPPALAHTATADADTRQALLGAGFRDVLVKPVPANVVKAALREALGLGPAPPPGALADWDDETATRALNGNREHIAALRKLFLAELPAVIDRVRNAFRNEDFQGLHAELHRLRASCGFVGATRLQQAVQRLGEDDRSHLRLQDFTLASQALLESVAPVATPG